MSASNRFFFFFFNDTATTEIYTLSLHDALPISVLRRKDHLHDHGEPAGTDVLGSGCRRARHLAAARRLRRPSLARCAALWGRSDVAGLQAPDDIRCERRRRRSARAATGRQGHILEPGPRTRR